MYDQNTLLLKKALSTSPAHIVQKDKELKVGRNPLVNILAGLSIYSMIFPILFLDISLSIYQQVYFSLLSIPKLKRDKYVIVERWKLPKLNLWQRINCIYCDYANGVVSWGRDVIAQSEIYSCAIKNSTSLMGQEHIEKYYDPELFR